MKVNRSIFRAHAVGFLLLVTAAASLPGHALARDHRPPQTVLRHASALQEGYLLQYCWVHPSARREATTQCVDNVWDFPPVERVVAGRTISIRIHKRQRPRNVELHAWAAVDQDDAPVGRRESIAHRLRRSGKSWDVEFSLDLPCRDYYLRLGGAWKDHQATGANQDSRWTFHTQTDVDSVLGRQRCAAGLADAPFPSRA